MYPTPPLYSPFTPPFDISFLSLKIHICSLSKKISLLSPFSCVRVSSMAEVQNGTETNGAAAVNTPAVVFSALKPQLHVEAPKASDAVQFYKTAFGAEEINRALQPKRKAEQDAPLVLSADLKLGSSVFCVADSSEVKTEGSGIVFNLETEDVNGAIAKAIEAGAVAVGEVTEEEGAGRVGKVKDPYGYTWVISSPSNVADVEA